jgi:hypothetical protein
MWPRINAASPILELRPTSCENRAARRGAQKSNSRWPAGLAPFPARERASRGFSTNNSQRCSSQNLSNHWSQSEPRDILPPLGRSVQRPLPALPVELQRPHSGCGSRRACDAGAGWGARLGRQRVAYPTSRAIEFPRCGSPGTGSRTGPHRYRAVCIAGRRVIRFTRASSSPEPPTRRRKRARDNTPPAPNTSGGDTRDWSRRVSPLRARSALGGLPCRLTRQHPTSARLGRAEAVVFHAVTVQVGAARVEPRLGPVHIGTDAAE